MKSMKYNTIKSKKYYLTVILHNTAYKLDSLLTQFSISKPVSRISFSIIQIIFWCNET